MLRGYGPLRKGGLEPRLSRGTGIKQIVAAYRAVRREDVRRRRVGPQSAIGARHIRHGSKLRPAGPQLKARAGPRDNAARSWPWRPESNLLRLAMCAVEGRGRGVPAQGLAVLVEGRLSEAQR